jgi:hypothetical protein
MEFGKDPTTGLYGLKVDKINTFGKEAASFMVEFTVCQSNDCELSSWEPVVAYKAGQCISFETTGIAGISTTVGSVSVYPNPFSETLNFEWAATSADASLEIIDQYGNTLTDMNSPFGENGKYHISLESSGLPKGMYYYRLTIDGKTQTGKISKR